MIPGISHHAPGGRMQRHRHAEGYIALVLSGGYVEAGDHGRITVEAGYAVVHRPHEAHADTFSAAGATVLNLPLEQDPGALVGRVIDPDAVARAAEREPAQVAALLAHMFRPVCAQVDDWPDRLAARLSCPGDFRLSEWAAQHGLAAGSVSRGFRRAYGTSPKRYRIEQRALLAARSIPSWQGSLAELAFELGFADQSHLGRAVVSLTGFSPRRLRVKSVQELGRADV
jgi:AraC-like DNA-binding protein